MTIKDEIIGLPNLKIPNKIMREIYGDYFLNLVSKKAELPIDSSTHMKILKEIALEGKIDEFINVLHEYLNNLSNRDFQKFDEKYVKLIAFCLAMNLKQFSVKSEMEVNRRSKDLIIMPRDKTRAYKSVMIEFKYLKKEDAGMLEEKKQEARKQIFEYSEFED